MEKQILSSRERLQFVVTTQQRSTLQVGTLGGAVRCQAPGAACTVYSVLPNVAIATKYESNESSGFKVFKLIKLDGCTNKNRYRHEFFQRRSATTCLFRGFFV